MLMKGKNYSANVLQGIQESSRRERHSCPFDPLFVCSKIGKVPRVFKEKSQVKTQQVREIWSQQLEHKQVAKRATEPGVRKGKRSLLACLTRCKCSMETTHNLVKIKLGIKVMELVECLISSVVTVTVGQESECHLTFVRGRLHIAE